VDIFTTSVALGSSNVERVSAAISLRSTRLTPNLSDHYEFPERSAQPRCNAVRKYRRLRKMFMTGVKEIQRTPPSRVTFNFKLARDTRRVLSPQLYFGNFCSASAVQWPQNHQPFRVRSRLHCDTTLSHNTSCRSGASSPQQGPSASNSSSPSQLRNRAGAASSSSIFVAGGVSYSFGSLRNDVMTSFHSMTTTAVPRSSERVSNVVVFFFWQ
jgi:hypothetical protein